MMVHDVMLLMMNNDDLDKLLQWIMRSESDDDNNDDDLAHVGKYCVSLSRWFTFWMFSNSRRPEHLHFLLSTATTSWQEHSTAAVCRTMYLATSPWGARMLLGTVAIGHFSFSQERNGLTYPSVNLCLWIKLGSRWNESGDLGGFVPCRA